MLMLGLYDAPPSQGGSLFLDATPFVTACTCTTDAHGFEALTAMIRQSLQNTFRTYDRGVLYAGLFSGGQIVWEGRLEDPTLNAGQGGSGLSIQALGYWRALSDLPYTAFWSATQIGGFTPTGSNQIATRTPEKWTLNTNNSQLYLAPNKNENFANVADAGALNMQSPMGDAGGFFAIQFDFDYKAPVNWKAYCITLTRVFGAGITSWTLNGTGAAQTGSICVSFAAFYDRVEFSFRNETGGNVLKATDTGVDYLKIMNARLVRSVANLINTTLAVARTNGSPVTCTVGSTARMYVGQRLTINSGGANSESVVVIAIPTGTTFTANVVNAPGGGYAIGTTVRAPPIYADEIAKDAVSAVNTLNSSQISISSALIQSPGLDLTDEVYEDAAIADVLTRLAGLGDNQTTPRRWEVGVWEGQTLFFRPQLSTSRAWYVDATDLSVVRTLEDLANSAYVTYQDANGVPQRTTPTSDSASITRYGLTRRISVQNNTTSATQATVVQAAVLADSKDPKPRATIRFTAVYNAQGGRYPLWLVRSGDAITIRNLPPNISTDIDRIRTFRITHTSYDAFADTLDVEPEAAPRTLEVMLARRNEGIIGASGE